MSLSKTGYYNTCREQFKYFVWSWLPRLYILALYDRQNLVVKQLLQFWLSQNLLRTEQTSCFILIAMRVVHFLSLGSPRRITNSLHYESFETGSFNSCREQLKSLVGWWLQCLWRILQVLALYDRDWILSQRSHCKSPFVKSYWKK